MNTNTKSNTNFMVQLALMAAIIILMAFTPLGYIRTPALSITLLTIPVAVGAIVLGPKGGAVCGAVFGATSFAQCFATGAFGIMLLQINPIATFITTMIPRILEGWLCGIIFQAICKTRFQKSAFYIASLACPLLNTLFFMSSLLIFFYPTEYIQSFVTRLGVSNPFTFVIAFVGVQGAIEAVICFLVASVVSRILWTTLKKGTL